MDKIIIVAGGQSAKDYHLDALYDYGYVIGVNESSVKVKCHEALSMDRLWMENRYLKLQELGLPTWFRACAWRKNIHWDNLNLFKSDISTVKFSKDKYILHGNNSGSCALNLAYQYKPKKLFLFGFDMTGTYWHQNYQWKTKTEEEGKYRLWMKRFDTHAFQFNVRNIKVYNVSPISKIECFERIGWDDFKRLAA